MDTRRQFLLNASKAGLLGTPAYGAFSAFAQSGRPTTLIAGFPPGGGPDLVARAVAEKIHAYLGRPVIVENKVGAGGRIVLEALKNGPTDGSLMNLSTSGTLTIHPHIYQKLPYAPLKDFVPVCKVCTYTLAVVTSADSPFKTLAEYLEWAKTKKNGNFGSAGSGNSTEFAGYLLSHASKIPLTPVAYRGGPQLTQAVVSGEVPIGINITSTFTPLAKAGKLRILAITGAKRSLFTPDVPTLLELGFKEMVIEDPMGIIAKAGTPQAVIDQWQHAVSKAMTETDLPAILQRLEYTPAYAQSNDYWKFITEQSVRWGKVIAESGFKPMD